MQDEQRCVMRAVDEQTGRVNQKLRTRTAIIEACRELIRSGGAGDDARRRARGPGVRADRLPVLPGPASLLNAALVGMWPSPAEALEPVAASADPVERVAFAAEFFLRRVLGYQGAVRAMISATITRPELAAAPPRHTVRPDRPGARPDRRRPRAATGAAGPAQARSRRGHQRGGAVLADRPVPPGPR